MQLKILIFSLCTILIIILQDLCFKNFDPVVFFFLLNKQYWPPIRILIIQDIEAGMYQFISLFSCSLSARVLTLPLFSPCSYLIKIELHHFFLSCFLPLLCIHYLSPSQIHVASLSIILHIHIQISKTAISFGVSSVLYTCI